jgi:hypothetical protein
MTWGNHPATGRCRINLGFRAASWRRTMRSARSLLLPLVILIANTSGALAQQAASISDSASAQIHARLRAFYFNLAHQNWEALTADILAAKVVAHRPAPGALLAAATSPAREAGRRGTGSSPGASSACWLTEAALVERASFIFDGDWAEVSVPRCAAGLAGADEFRLIRFEDRWRFVYIRRFQPPVRVSAER